MDPRKRIIVALDVDSRAEALRLVHQLQGKVGLFKVGSQLFTAEGPQLVRDIIEMGEQVFLDLKFHDIPNTAVKSALVTQHLGVSMMTVHAGGGLKMMSSIMNALPGFPRPLVLGVTVLTSLSNQDLQEVGCDADIADIRDQVIRLARLAQQAGLDGVVASPNEIESLRLQLGNTLMIVTPGIRPLGNDRNDQNRTATPVIALRAGADYLVIGRPITASPDPAESVARILESLKTEQV